MPSHFDRPLPPTAATPNGGRACPLCLDVILHPSRCRTPSHCLIEYGPVAHEHGFCSRCRINLVWCHDDRPISVHNPSRLLQ